MQQNDAIALAVIALMVLVLIYYVDSKNTKATKAAANFTAAAAAAPSKPAEKPFITHSPNPSHGGKKLVSHAERATYDPEGFIEDERRQRESGGVKSQIFTPETRGNVDTYNDAGSVDYSAYITDQVVDTKIKDSHKKWTDEIKPWSGTATKTPDNLDEALEASVHFHGLRRPKPIKQYNPHQLTELDETSLSGNQRERLL
jgi:hypothetical protein